MPSLALLRPSVIEIRVAEELIKTFWTWVAAMPIEISALAEGDIVGDTAHITSTIHILKQSGSKVHTNFDLSDVSRLMRSTDPSRLICWVHSHPQNSVFFSSEDLSTISKVSKLVPVLVAGVFNELGEMIWGLRQGSVWLETAERRQASLELSPTREEIAAAQELLRGFVTKRLPRRLGRHSRETFATQTMNLCWERNSLGHLCRLYEGHWQDHDFDLTTPLGGYYPNAPKYDKYWL